MLRPPAQFNAVVLGEVVRGHQVASGESTDSPYPRGTIALQKPVFKKLGLDLANCFNGTINVLLSTRAFKIRQPELKFEQIEWLKSTPKETFSFAQCGLEHKQSCYLGWIYYPHPETKTRHFQPPNLIEVLAPPIPQLTYGSQVAIHYQTQSITVA